MDNISKNNPGDSRQVADDIGQSSTETDVVEDLQLEYNIKTTDWYNFNTKTTTLEKNAITNPTRNNFSSSENNELINYEQTQPKGGVKVMNSTIFIGGITFAIRAVNSRLQSLAFFNNVNILFNENVPNIIPSNLQTMLNDSNIIDNTKQNELNLEQFFLGSTDNPGSLGEVFKIKQYQTNNAFTTAKIKSIVVKKLNNGFEINSETFSPTDIAFEYGSLSKTGGTLQKINVNSAEEDVSFQAIITVDITAEEEFTTAINSSSEDPKNKQLLSDLKSQFLSKSSTSSTHEEILNSQMATQPGDLEILGTSVTRIKQTNIKYNGEYILNNNANGRLEFASDGNIDIVTPSNIYLRTNGDEGSVVYIGPDDRNLGVSGSRYDKDNKLMSDLKENGYSLTADKSLIAINDSQNVPIIKDCLYVNGNIKALNLLNTTIGSIIEAERREVSKNAGFKDVVLDKLTAEEDVTINGNLTVNGAETTTTIEGNLTVNGTINY